MKLPTFLFFLGTSLAQSAIACLDAPLPTDPTGPTWSTTLERRLSSGSLIESTEMTVWREPCTESEGLLLVTLEPLVSEPFICNSQFNVIQGGQQFGNFRLRQDPENSSGFCDDLFVTTTFAVGQSQFDAIWDDNAAFELIWNSGSSPVHLDVGRYRFADYVDLPPPEDGVPLQGALSGTWRDISRSGEGFVFEFGEDASGTVLTAFWFTYLEGRQYWLLGIAPYSIGDTNISMDLLEFTASGFGDEFDPDTLSNRHFGSITFKFDTCRTGTAEWTSDIGLGSGTFDISRITGGIDRADCVQ